MGKKGLMGAIVSLIGGFILGYAHGVQSAIATILSPIPELTAKIAGSVAFGLLEGMGKNIGNALVEKLQNHIKENIFDPSPYYFAGAIITLAGIYCGYRIKESAKSTFASR